MRKRILCYLIIFILGCTACNSSSTKKCSDSVLVNYGKTFITDDESSVLNFKPYCENYYHYDELEFYLKKEYKHKNNDYYWILYHENISNVPPIYVYTVNYDTYEETDITSISAYYFVCDDELGYMSNTELDGYAFSIVFAFSFYKVDKNSEITTFLVDYISNKKIKITVMSDSRIVGYVYAEYGNYDAVEYIISYLKRNLILL